MRGTSVGLVRAVGVQRLSLATFVCVGSLLVSGFGSAWGFGLSDGRSYELVTAPQKNGALISALPFRHPFAVLSEDGLRVIAPSDQCFGDPESCTSYRLTEGDPYEFERTSGGWVTHALAPPAAVGESSSVWTANANAGTALFSAAGSVDGPDDFFGRFEPAGSEGGFVEVGPFGEANGGTAAQQPNPSYITVPGVYSTADLSHIVYETSSRLWSFDESERRSVYEYTHAGSTTPLMVGVEGGPGSHSLVSTCSTLIAGQAAFVEAEALSEDGHTVYFSALGRDDSLHCAGAVKAPAATGLYARVDGESPDAHTVLISAPTPGVCTTGVCEENTSKANEVADGRDSEFEGASADGSHVLFTSTQQLTNNASQAPGSALYSDGGCGAIGESGCNLYESVCLNPCGAAGEEPDAAGRKLFDVSKGAQNSGGPRVQGVMAISTDGSHVYFVARGVLTGGEENQNGEKAENEKENLYLYTEGTEGTEGHVVFIARLSGSDEQNAQWADSRGSNLVANVSPNGQFLVFTDDKALTADDTRVGPAAEGAAQVFEYDAQTELLKRISVGAEGYDENGNGGSGDAHIAIADRGGASDESVPIRLDPTMSADGQLVFFESPIALVPGALNDVPIGNGLLAENIYEYFDGKVSLISDGSDAAEQVDDSQSEVGAPTELLGVSASGANVVFTTFDELTPEDTDTDRDYYDAHMCDAPSEPCIERATEARGCVEGGCQGPGAAVSGVGASGSATFSGPGNLVPAPATVVVPATRAQLLAKALKACRTKANKHKRGVCEATARKRYGPVKPAKKSARKARKSSRDAGSGRGAGS